MDGAVSAESLPSIREARGVTRIGTAPGQIPFPVRRFFTVSEVPDGEVRGCHAHRTCEQVLVAVSGGLVVDAWDVTGHQRLVLGTGDYVHVPAGIFTVQSQFTPGAVLLVLASEAYDPTSMIQAREYFGAACCTHAGTPQRRFGAAPSGLGDWGRPTCGCDQR